VECAIRACCQRRFGSRELDGRTVAVVGLGHVGSQLARRLTRAGAKVIAGEINPDKRKLLDELDGARWADPSTALLAEVDVLAPCALGSAIDEVTVRKVRCRIVCGAANNQLAHEGLADDLAARGILFAPDYIANAGGLINISIELEGYDPKVARQRVAGIEQTMGQILDEAEVAGISPLAAADEHARRRLAAGSGSPR
jgi:leucine dehydrogenase